MPSVPPERKLFASYALWRRHVDPDGLVSASEFAEMDTDDKREAMRELGGAMPAEAGADDLLDTRAEDEDTAVAEDDDEDSEFVELTEDVVDERSTDPFA